MCCLLVSVFALLFVVGCLLLVGRFVRCSLFVVGRCVLLVALRVLSVVDCWLLVVICLLGCCVCFRFVCDVLLVVYE